eukprot:TCONS_00054716-protein
MEMKKAKLDLYPSESEMSPRSFKNHAAYWAQLFNGDPKINKHFECPSQIQIRDTKLEKEIFEYLSNVVPSLLTENDVGGVLRYVTNTEKFEKLIAQELEYFLCNSYNTKETLEEFSNPTKFCGKVFELGDPTYTCKDCAADPTCVFCHDCFFNSEHQHHKYRLHASSGTGGYCDCGDDEAWSTNPACNKHKEGLDVDEAADPTEKLPEDLKRRSIFLIHFLIQYCVDLICWEETDELPHPLVASESGKENFIVMLFNDESHTYDEVIETLTKTVPGCGNNQALHFATIVDKMGRSAIVKGKKEICTEKVALCRELTSRNNKDPLKCEALIRDLVAHQCVAQSLMNWLLNTVNMSDGLRRILTVLSTKHLYGRQSSILEQVISVDVQLWKAARHDTHQLFMNGILMDMYGRQQFAITFCKNYSQIMSEFIKDDHEHSISVASLSVQIYTVPTIAHMLLEEQGVLQKCFSAFWNELKPAMNSDHGWLDFQPSQVIKVKRADFILRDIGYLLRNKPKWSDKIKTEFLLAFDKIVQLLKAMQGMDSCERYTKSHVTYEPNWESGFNLQVYLVPIIEMLLHWTCTNFEVYKVVMFKCVTELMKIYPKLDFKVVNNSLICDYDVSKKLVSVHSPLSRFIAGLIPAAVKFSDINNLKELLQIYDGLPEKDRLKTQVTLIEAPLRTLVLMGQEYAQMWKRNGYAIHHQIFYYHNVKFGTEMFDRDVLLVQIMGSLMSPNHFLDVILQKYKLHDFFSSSMTGEKVEGETIDKTRILAHECFHLLYFILVERYVVNLSEISARDILRREVCHRLALGPATRSSLVKNLPFKDHEDDSSVDERLDDVLRDVSEYKSPGLDGKGTYQLRDDLMKTTSQYFLHYTRNERAKFVEQKKKHAKLFPNMKEYELTDLPEWNPLFQNILRVFECDRMDYILRCVLKNPDHFGSEETVELALFIVGTGLIEAKRHPSKLPNFLPMLSKPIEEGKNIKNLLEEMLKSGKHSDSGIFKWVIELLRQAHPDEDNLTMELDQDNNKEAEETERLLRKKRAQEQRAKMMAKMNNMQKAFMQSHQGFFSEGMDVGDETDGASIISPSTFPVVLGSKCTVTDSSIGSDPVQCILCQEEQSIDNDEKMFLMTCFQQKSSVFNKSGTKPNSRDVSQITAELNGVTMTHVSSCGHILHSECWNKFYTTIKERYRSLARTRSIDVLQSEYLCPLCNSLCNTVLPILPRLEEEKSEDSLELSLSEFLSYVDKFSSELSTLPKKKVEKEDRKTKSRSFISMGVRMLQSYIRVAELEQNENVMDMFPKKLMQLDAFDENSGQAIPLSWMVFSFTLQTLECIHREGGTNMFEEILERDWMFFYAFVQYLSSTAMATVYEPIQEYGTEVFNFFCDENNDFTLNSVDVFGLMVSLRCLMSTCGHIFQEKQPNFMKIKQNQMNDVIFKVCFVAQYVKALLQTPGLHEDDQMQEGENESGQDDENVEYLVKAWKYVQSMIGPDNQVVNGHVLKERVTSSLLPFLRCSAIFFHLLVGVSMPEDLKLKTMTDSLEMSSLLRYMNLPTNLSEALSFDKLFNDPTIKLMVDRWCSDIRREQLKLVRPIKDCYLSSRRLVDLPEQYSTLIKRASGFKCPTVGDTSRSPALCLICGEMICSQCYCCVNEKGMPNQSFGASAVHIQQCGQGVGAFLKIRDCEIYLLYNQRKGVFIAAPYLDSYGEPDRGFHRGNPLFLDKGRYERIQNYWLKHKIPTTIVQAMEKNRNLLAFDWNMI